MGPGSCLFSLSHRPLGCGVQDTNIDCGPSCLLGVFELTTHLVLPTLHGPSCRCSPISTAIPATLPHAHM